MNLGEQVTPESGATYYYFDSSAPDCTGTYDGDLIEKKDADGNISCFTYDLQDRMTAETHPGGVVNRYFVYGAATVSGTINGAASQSEAMPYPLGHLTEAYTATCSTCTKVTDDFLGYSKLGQVSDVFEAMPGSGGYYHVGATYFANGRIEQLNTAGAGASLALPSLPEISYLLDGEARVYTVGDSVSTLLTSDSYTTDGAGLTVLNFGSGDGDTFVFDPDTGRMTKFNLEVNNQTLAGTLTWNGNATLASLQVTDPWNSNNNQTCNYGYDALARLASVGCGSIWAQTFTPDAYGNVAIKAGTQLYDAAFNDSTNRVSSVGGVTPSYNNRGDVLNDGAHAYA